MNYKFLFFLVPINLILFSLNLAAQVTDPVNQSSARSAVQLAPMVMQNDLECPTFAEGSAFPCLMHWAQADQYCRNHGTTLPTPRQITEYYVASGSGIQIRETGFNDRFFNTITTLPSSDASAEELRIYAREVALRQQIHEEILSLDAAGYHPVMKHNDLLRKGIDFYYSNGNYTRPAVSSAILRLYPLYSEIPHESDRFWSSGTTPYGLAYVFDSYLGNLDLAVEDPIYLNLGASVRCLSSQ